MTTRSLADRRLRKIVCGVFIALNFVALANIIWVRLNYDARMPRLPQPETGRVQAVIANHSRVYVTAQEAGKLDRANAMAIGCTLLALIGIYIAFGVRKVDGEGWNGS